MEHEEHVHRHMYINTLHRPTCNQQDNQQNEEEDQTPSHAYRAPKVSAHFSSLIFSPPASLPLPLRASTTQTFLHIPASTRACAHDVPSA